MIELSPLLHVEGLHIETTPRHGDARALLHGLSFSMRSNEFLALVGESGSGKTLVARSILNLLPPGVRCSAGTIAFCGSPLTTLSPAQMRTVRGSQIGMVFQEPMVSLNPAMTIGRQLAEGLQLHRKLGAEQIRTESLDMLAKVQIRDPEQCLKSYPHEFSGGMRQRIMLASVLLLKPRLLIADEPTTALDTLSQREVMDLMVTLARESGVATLLITHDLGLVARYANRVVVLEKGHLIETGDTRQVLTNPVHSYTKRLVSSRPHRGTQYRSSPVNAKPLLQVNDVCISYDGHRGLLRAGKPQAIVHDVNLSLCEGQIAGLVGASGSGKTTLGRAIMRLKQLTSGSIEFDGKDISALSSQSLRNFHAQAQFVFQDPFSSLDPRMRVMDIVKAPLRHQPGSDAERRQRVENVLNEVGLAGFGDRFPHQMSGGQRQRIAIARAVVSRPRLIVADEPVSALDMTIQAQVLALFQKLQADYGFACLFITHDLAVVEQIADRVIVMSKGRIVEAGPTADVMERPQHPYTRELLDATPRMPE